jgi:hypothetical protein
MIEWLWAGLLVLAVSHRSGRALALLLAFKWAANYAAFNLVGEGAPALVDVALGTVGVVWASRRRTWWSDVVIAGFVLTPLVHAWYWLPQASGAVSARAYYWLVVGLFTLQVAALAWPAARERRRTVVRWLKARRAQPSGSG